MSSSNTKALKAKEQGNSGTAIQGGQILMSDYNPKLSGKNAIPVYEEMRNDASVNAGLEAIKLPIQSADITADPASEDEADVKIADEINEQLDRLKDQYLVEALTFLDFGHCVHEMVFQPMELQYGWRLGLARLGYRKQTTIEAWETEDHQPGITQRDALGQAHSIPAVKLVRLTRKQEGDNYLGISILRTSYRNFYIKDKLYKIDAVGHERHALGVLDITVPKGATKEDKTRMRKLARGLRANQEMYLEHPEGWEVQFLDNKSNTLRDIEPSINHHDRQIMKNVLAQFLEIGSSGSSGTRSVSEDQSRLFELAVQSVAKQIVSALQNSFVKAYVDLNYTGRAYPTLRVANLSDDNIPVISEAVNKLVGAKALHPTKSDENTVRRMVGWPELEDEQLDDIYQQPEQATTDDAKKTDELKADDIQEAVKKAHGVRATLTRLLYGRSSNKS